MDLSSVFKYIFRPLLFLRLQALTSFFLEGVALRMVESTVTFFIEKLGNLVLHEASLFGQVEGQIKLLWNELEWMRLFLRDADSKRIYDERIKLWVNQIRKVRRGFSWKSYNSFEPSHPQIPNLHSNQSAYLCGIPRQATIHSRA